MELIIFVAAMAVLVFAWRFTASTYIKKGHNKILSHLAGAAVSILAFFTFLIFILELTGYETKEHESAASAESSQAPLAKPSPPPSREPTAQVPAVVPPRYTIIKNESMPPFKHTIEIVLDEQATTAQLEFIAHSIRNAEKHTYDRTFIGYYLKTDLLPKMYWATSHFNPELEVVIYELRQ